MDILLPVDAVLGLLATAVEREREAQKVPGMVDPHLAQREGVAVAAAAAEAEAAAAAAEAEVASTTDGAADGVVLGAGSGGGGGSVPQGAACVLELCRAAALRHAPSRDVVRRSSLKILSLAEAGGL